MSRANLVRADTEIADGFASCQIAAHVLGQHRYRAVGEDGRSVVSDAQARSA